MLSSSPSLPLLFRTVAALLNGIFVAGRSCSTIRPRAGEEHGGEHTPRQLLRAETLAAVTRQNIPGSVAEKAVQERYQAQV